MNHREQEDSLRLKQAAGTLAPADLGEVNGGPVR